MSRTYYGSAAHLIVGPWCRFHLATKVPGFLISTVGEFVPVGTKEAAAVEYTDIGYQRKYETMVFRTGDETCHCGCGIPIPTEWSEIDMRGYNTAKDATEGHEALCQQYETGQPSPALEPTEATQ